MPAWVVIITISMAVEWLRLIQQNAGTGTMVFNTIKVWLCEVLLVVTYPLYFYVFTTLSKTSQMFFASLLPVIKLIMRNIFTLTVVHLSDEMPEVVVFNSEVFNALFVSYSGEGAEAKELEKSNTIEKDINFEERGIIKPFSGARIQPAPLDAEKQTAHEVKEITATSLQYVLEVRRLLYLTVFLVLINYVGVFIPLIFYYPTASITLNLLISRRMNWIKR
ncbi:hypothetical protein JG688_00012829 [Phytophthora aleatoria]|uniref:Uncharacterized protein n=1 Tax=Phytophthora aleatoria TaxID=2496075 RepID=A0A8J5IJX0_9STRA|nr:hypothetical protein JG688_00012829 [Phytophthora aleatoria]